jgi:hypothetical protein
VLLKEVDAVLARTQERVEFEVARVVVADRVLEQQP